MLKGSSLFALTSVLLYAGIASAQQPQYPIMERIVQKVIEKYQNSSCQQLAQEKSQPPSGRTSVASTTNPAVRNPASDGCRWN